MVSRIPSGVKICLLGEDIERFAAEALDQLTKDDEVHVGVAKLLARLGEGDEDCRSVPCLLSPVPVIAHRIVGNRLLVCSNRCSIVSLPYRSARNPENRAYSIDPIFSIFLVPAES